MAIVIATEGHRRAFGARLAAAGIDLPRADGEQTVVELDAAEVLARFMPARGFHAEAFRREGWLRRGAAAATGGPVHVHREMVQLLWDAGMVVAALELEELWNDVVREHHCSLMCSNRRSSVSGCEHARALQRVWELHSAVLPPLVSEVESQRSRVAATYRQVADTLERSAELAEQHAESELHHGRSKWADTELERAKRARASANRGRELASHLERH